MSQFLFDPVFLIFSCMAICCVVPTITYFVYKARKDQLDNDLKREMLQRGMSADDIVKVLNASSESHKKGFQAESDLKSSQPINQVSP